jgi:hypothetical protein
MKPTVIVHSPYPEKRPMVDNITPDSMTICDVERFYGINDKLYIEIIGTGGSVHSGARVLSVYPNTKGASTYKLSLEFVDMSETDKEKLKSLIEKAC